VVHAVEQARFGPFAPVRIATWPAAKFTIVAVTRERRYVSLTLLQQLFVLPFDYLKTTNAGNSLYKPPHDRVLRIDLQTGILDRAVCRGNRQLNEAALSSSDLFVQ